MTIGKIEQLKSNEEIINSTPGDKRGKLVQDILQPIQVKVNELTDAVNDLEATVYGGDDECDDICPHCWAETEPFIANLPSLSDEQLIALHDRVADLLDQRLEADDEECDCDDDDEVEVCLVSQKDGLLFDLVKMCKDHPELRLWQALRNLSGYNFIFGSTAKSYDDYSQLEDTVNLTTWGPRKGGK